mmetsp:Transcript_25620/g.58308  ORF Transcript_25620/g.58308 Transcript_25620/m.58308 type:complete len:329 (-) Transcript_25620:32-1018(-)
MPYLGRRTPKLSMLVDQKTQTLWASGIPHWDPLLNRHDGRGRLPRGGGQLRAHLVDGLLVVRAVEDGRASDEHVSARLSDLLDVLGSDTAIDLEGDVKARLVNHLARLLELVQGSRDERLATEARVDGHEQDNVNLVHHVLQDIKRRGRVEHEARLAATRADQLERAVNVAGGLRVEGDVVGARVRKAVDDVVDGRDHEVHVDGRLDAVVLERLADHRADSQVGHVVVVHHVKVDHISARRKHVLDLLAKLREVGAENGGRNPVVSHHLHLHLACRDRAARAHGEGDSRRGDEGKHCDLRHVTTGTPHCCQNRGDGADAGAGRRQDGS